MFCHSFTVICTDIPISPSFMYSLIQKILVGLLCARFGSPGQHSLNGKEPDQKRKDIFLFCKNFGKFSMSNCALLVPHFD